MTTRISLLLTLLALLGLSLTACGYRRSSRTINPPETNFATQPAAKSTAPVELDSPQSAPAAPAQPVQPPQPTQSRELQPTPASVDNLDGEVDALEQILDGINQDLDQMDDLENLP